MSTPVDELARRALAGDAACWRELFDALSSRLFGHLRRLGTRPDDAAELIQETWLRIVKNQEKYDPARPFEPFIFTIATRLWIDARRRDARTPATMALPDDAAHQPPLPLDLLFAAEQTERMRHCLAVLSAEEREIIVLRYWQGLTSRQIGERLGASPDAIKGKSYRAVRKLADCMNLEESDQIPSGLPSAGDDAA